jgi:hypothetical protein
MDEEEQVAKQNYEEKYTDPELREKVKEEIKASEKGGKKGQWSARKSQLLTQGVREAGRWLQGREGPVEHGREGGDGAEEARGLEERPAVRLQLAHIHPRAWKVDSHK